MSTHATIAVVMDNTIMINGLTYDGYLDYTGRALLKHFNDLTKASKLTHVNEMRSIDLDTGEIDCYESSEYYPHQLSSIYDWYKSMPVEEYNYIFVDGKWFLYSPAKLIPLQGEDKYEALLLGEAQIVPHKIQDDSELMDEINTLRNKSLMALAQKALAPVDGQCSLGFYDDLRVRITGDFTLEYDLDSDIWRYPFYNGVDLESLDDDSGNFQSNMEDIVSELDINWKAEPELDELYSASLKQHIESSKRENADQEKVPLATQYKQIEDFMKSLLDLLPESERSKVENQIYYDTRKNSLQFMLNVNESSPHFFIYYDKNKGAKSDVGAVQCWIRNGYLNGAVYHDGDFEPFAGGGRKFNGNLECLVNGLVDTCSLTKLPG